MKPNSTVSLSAVLLCAVLPALCDTKIASRYVADGQTTETLTYAHGQRLRYNYGKGQSLLQQCDLKRFVQLDDTARTFLAQPAEQPPADATKATTQVEVVDLQERKDMFGYPARHLKITESTPGSKARTETDGWYVELKEMLSCSAAASDANASASPGFPVVYTTTSFGENGKPSSTLTMEVTDLSVAPLDAALFDVPAGYKEAGKPTDAPALPKSSGATRIATVPLRNKSDRQALSTAPYSHLLSQLQAAQIDVLPIADGSDDAIKTKASQAQCDYIMYTELISVQKPPLSKVGGLIHKTPIVGRATDGDEYEARVDYRLVPLSEGASAIESSAVVKKGHSFNWVGAAVLASNFIPITTAARMLGGSGGLNPAMLNAILKNGAAGGSMTHNMDPMMGGMSMFLRSANGVGSAGGAPNPAGMDAAIAAALDQQGKALVEQLKK